MCNKNATNVQHFRENATQSATKVQQKRQQNQQKTQQLMHFCCIFVAHWLHFKEKIDVGPARKLGHDLLPMGGKKRKKGGQKREKWGKEKRKRRKGERPGFHHSFVHICTALVLKFCFKCLCARLLKSSYSIRRNALK